MLRLDAEVLLHDRGVFWSIRHVKCLTKNARRRGCSRNKADSSKLRRPSMSPALSFAGVYGINTTEGKESELACRRQFASGVLFRTRGGS
jgi:hypothetical protein